MKTHTHADELMARAVIILVLLWAAAFVLAGYYHLPGFTQPAPHWICDYWYNHHCWLRHFGRS